MSSAHRSLVAHDERAFNGLVVAYEQRVFRLLLRMLGRRDEARTWHRRCSSRSVKALGQLPWRVEARHLDLSNAVNLCKNRMKYLQRRHSSEEASSNRWPSGGAERGQGVTFGETSRHDHMVKASDSRHRSNGIAELDPTFAKARAA